jgi:hypothetical protein
MARSLSRGGKPTQSLRTQIGAGTLTDPWPTLNLVQGTGMSLSLSNNTSQKRADLTIAASGASAAITVLDAGSTATQINTALTNFNIVYLKAGNYSIGGTQIAIPTGKALIGISPSSSQPLFGTTVPVTLASTLTSGTIVSMGQGTTLMNIVIDGPNSGTSTGVTASSGSCTIENVSVQQTLGNGFEVSLSGGTRMENCVAIDCGTGFNLDGGGLASDMVTDVSYCYAFSCNSHGFSIDSSDGTVYHIALSGCVARANGGNGFGVGSMGGSGTMVIMGCHSYSNTGDGFNVIGPGHTTIMGCHAYDNTGNGFDVPTNSSLRNLLHSNIAYNNTAGNYVIGTAWSNTGNATGS